MKKKEIVFVILILIFTFALSFSSDIKKIISNTDSSKIKHDRYITITLEGEIAKNISPFQVPYGSSFGDIYSKTRNIYNEYSVLPYKHDERFYESMTIVISTTDNGAYDKVKKENAYKININTAEKIDLKKVYGIGDKRAEKIIAYRSSKAFESYEELQEVLGVSDNVIEQIKIETILG